MSEEREDRKARDEREDIDIRQEGPTPFPLGDEVAGPGTVREGSGYSGTTSGGVETGTGHDPSPYDEPTAGYMGDTTSSDEPPVEEIIELNPNEE